MATVLALLLLVCHAVPPASLPRHLPHLHARNLVGAELARREQPRNGGVHNRALLGRPAGERLPQPLAQLRGRAAGGRSR